LDPSDLAKMRQLNTNVLVVPLPERVTKNGISLNPFFVIYFRESGKKMRRWRIELLFV
jgi:hypothetical protein